ncbi:MAG: UDP-3-O-(3-hydroxymyristoyl)glucosamine N-acyltransferase [Bacteroidales bacterium]|jgi:UDP-3-O-[3-hydroxymyristoyl] glucosamine N-acyltransferase|nr:UDP-3-O-(3-hydroxymyristoyl)glucosamine N-acyltransferase [Bacteroidales bacterium]
MKFEKSYTVSSLASLLGREHVGPDQQIIGLNEIHMVEPGDITFVDHPKYYDKALNSKATIILINKEVEPPQGKSLIISDDPFADFVKIIRKHRPFIPATSAISPHAEIGEDTIIQPNVFIGDHVKIGKNCIIHANVSIHPYTEIGDNVIIHSSSVIGGDAYYFQKKNGRYRKFETAGRTIIRNDVEIGAACTIDCGVTGDTFIDDGCKFDNHVQVGHDTFIGKNCLIGSQCAIAGVTKIEDDVILWARVAVNKDIVVGKGTVILATSALDKSVPSGGTYFGSPAQPVMLAWREIAAMRQLPDLLQKLSEK